MKCVFGRSDLYRLVGATFRCCIGCSVLSLGVNLLAAAPVVAKEMWLKCGSAYVVALDRSRGQFSLEMKSGQTFQGPASFDPGQVVLELRVRSQSEQALSRGMDFLERVPSPFGLAGLLKAVPVGKKYEFVINRKTLAFALSSFEPAGSSARSKPQGTVELGAGQQPGSAASRFEKATQASRADGFAERVTVEAGTCKKIPSPHAANQL